MWIIDCFLNDYNDMTRNNGHKLCHKRFITNIAKNFFKYDVIDKWNRLPAVVVNSNNIDSFKKNLDKYLKDNGY